MIMKVKVGKNKPKGVLNDFIAYQKSKQLWDQCWKDCETLSQDSRGKEIARQMIRSAGSISANIEEGYGGGNNKEFPQYLRIARGSAQEALGWYNRSKFILEEGLLRERTALIQDILAILTTTIKTLSTKNKE